MPTVSMTSDWHLKSKLCFNSPLIETKLWLREILIMSRGFGDRDFNLMKWYISCPITDCISCIADDIYLGYTGIFTRRYLCGRLAAQEVFK